MKQLSLFIALILFSSTIAIGQITPNTPTVNTPTIKPKTPTIKKANVIKMKKDLKVGDVFQGGYVVRIWDNGNHGLICAKEDLGTYKWGKNSESGAPSIGSDLEANQALVAELGAGEYAAKACADYRGGGYDDWYLPSRQQFNMIYNGLFKTGKAKFNYGSYWTINQSLRDNGYDLAWAIRISRNSPNFSKKEDVKSTKKYVLPVREF